MQKNSNPILVTGASGYIASHTIKLLLEKGYQVRGTVRSLDNKDKYKFLYDLVPEKSSNLSLVEADLLDAKSWLKAVEGCDLVLHIASPIPPGVPKDENEIIKPAVEGTVNVLNAAVEKGVKRVVVTSSGLAIFFGNDGKICSEEDWSDASKASHYPKSKILAEKAAWEFYEKNKKKIEVAVVNPTMVIGPGFSKHNNSSEAFIASLLSGSFPGIYDITYAIVDVRDAAEGHVRALFDPDANGQRFILSGTHATLADIVKNLKDDFDKYGYSFPSKSIGAQEVKDSQHPVALRQLGLIGKKLLVTNEKSVKQLKMKYNSLKDSCVDMGYALIKLGIVDDKTASK